MNKSRFTEALKKHILIMDGAMGTLLHARGLKPGQAPEELNLTAPDIVASVHTDYFNAGSHIVLANTFGATRRKLAEFGLEYMVEKINHSAVRIARKAAAPFQGFVAGDIGPLGSYLSPLGSLTWDEAYALFAEQVKALASAEPDLIIIETMSDIREVKAALRAAKDFFNGPVFAQMTFTKDGATVTGTDPLSFITVAEAMGADGIGVNCSVGPKNLFPIVKTLAQNTHLPLSVKPNRGMPRLINRQTVYPGTVQEFISYAQKFIALGVNMIGGCCGTDPQFISALAQKFNKKKPKVRHRKLRITRFCSRTETLVITPSSPLIKIGERINPTGRKILQQELQNFDFTLVRNDARAQVKAGAHMLDVNMGLAGGNEKKLMAKAMDVVQSTTRVPLCIDSSNPDALETALKQCEGKPLVNSVSGEEHKLKSVLPLIKRYGAGVIGLLIDENGIPKTASERINIAKKIIAGAKKHHIPQDDIIIDALSLAVSAEGSQAKETLKSIKHIAKKMKLKTILGISNVSFGLPNRPALNSTFLNMARKQGLSCAIMNPLVAWSKNDPYAYAVLSGNDPNCRRYLQQYSGMPKISKQSATIHDIRSIREKLNQAVHEGIQESIYPLIDTAIKEHIPPQEIINGILFPALEEVGEKFVRKIYFLPQVLLCADTMQKGFLYLQGKFPRESAESPGTLLLATVQDDIHDIGKNIVKSVFQNHCWKVIDLGKNVKAEIIIEKAKITNPHIIGLSALMTTTMVYMEDIVKLKNKAGLSAKIMIGGAAVTQKYADSINADGYASDAVQAVRLAEQLIKKHKAPSSS